MSAGRSAPAGDFDYERHGGGYSSLRQEDPHLAKVIHKALGDARTVLNVGAGAGSYEPTDRHVTAVEPAASMRAQRTAGRVPAVDATAESLPFDDDSFDAAMAILTVHQWPDLDRGLRELRRVTRDRVVVFTFDGAALDGFWLTEYVPEVLAVERRRFPAIDHIVDVLGGNADVITVPVPRDCTDGFGEAYYARPEAFLDERVRAAQSGWMLADEAAIERGVARLSADLASGEWDRQYGHLREQPEHLGAVRLVVARPAVRR